MASASSPAADATGGLYQLRCAPCHGATGDGQGVAAPWLNPTPRDFRAGYFKWRSSVGAATEADISNAIAWGAPGTSMPAFAAHLTRDEIAALARYVRSLGASAFPATSPIALAELPPPSNASRGAALWPQRGCPACHGSDGNSGPPGLAYDITRGVHRPRPDDTLAAKRRAIAMSIATGVGAMPSFAAQISADDIWALADHVLAIQRPAPPRLRDLPLATTTVTPGVWPGRGPEAVLFGGDLQHQPPATTAPALASLSALQCARCHAAQWRDWRTSIHARASSPGLLAQLDHGASPQFVESCQRCHAPLAEQHRHTRDGKVGIVETAVAYSVNHSYQAGLRNEGITCAACHVRNGVRHGPPTLAASLLALPSYPKQPLEIYERADFCLPCHQLPPQLAVAGSPLLDTYREWLLGPYMKAGVQCQHCHMPNREHTFRGVHDPDTFAQGLAVRAQATRRRPNATISSKNPVYLTVTLHNVGAGHYLPATPTPAAWLVVEWLDAQHRILQRHDAYRIGRDVKLTTKGWVEHADTRLAPGEARSVSVASRDARIVAARVYVRVHPDAFYQRVYEGELSKPLPPAQHTQYAQALAAAKASYRVHLQVLPL